eukprot:1366037-Alexandrium_andersonii.AAC.1
MCIRDRLLWLLIFLAGVWVGRRGSGVAAVPSPLPPRGQSRAEKWLDGAESLVASKFVRGGEVLALDGQ